MLFVSGLACPQRASAGSICKLRKKLAQAGADNLIGTVWGRGYMLRDMLRDPAATATKPQAAAPSKLPALAQAA